MANKKKSSSSKKSKKKNIRNDEEPLFNFSEIKKSDTVRVVLALLLLFASIFMFLAFITYSPLDQSFTEQSGIVAGKYQNMMGSLGAQTADYFMARNFGFPSILIPVFFMLFALRLMHVYKVNVWRSFVNLSWLMIWGSVAFAYFWTASIRDNIYFAPGGKHGEFICNYLTLQIGEVGTFMIIVITAILYLIYLSHRTVIVIKKTMNGEYIMSAKNKLIKKKNTETEEPVATLQPADVIDTPSMDEKEQEEETTPTIIDYTIKDPEFLTNDKQPTSGKKKTDDNDLDLDIEDIDDEEKAEGGELGATQYDPTKDLASYKFPTLNLLKHYEGNGINVDMTEQNANKDRIIQILRNFGVEISSIKATVGPTITLYEITPAEGVRIAKIRNLEDDIALSLSAMGIRIIAPIPGKGTVGIEVPNNKPQIVSAESIFNSKKFQETTFDLPVALGKTITNDVYVADLAKMPHLLVAGATGQGKSVGLNIIIASLLYKKHPNELKIVLIDPKKVEFSVYGPLDKFFIAKVDDGNDDVIITDVNKVKKTLNSLCKEMDDRYQLLKTAKVRNIKEYNERFKNRMLNPENGHRFLPYIVVIIDEFGDLIMTAGKEIELPIARIAQLARAVGIHMVIATQRPTTNIITGTIKANFPARMAFRVSQMIDSRTILDKPGANQLIGKGDMLFVGGGGTTDRIQCGFIDTPEVEEITRFISSQKVYPQPYLLPDVADEGLSEGGSSGDMSNGNLDSMFEEVARMVVASQVGSTSNIQRKFSIGYNRAGKLMDQLECVGIVGPAQGAKPREVYIQSEAQLNELLEKLK